MSEDEKRTLRALALLEMEEARQELAHIQEKFTRVAEAYRAAANSICQARGSFEEIQILDGRVRFGLRPPKPDVSNLLDGEKLFALIEERDKARANLDAASQRGAELGIRCLS